MPNPPCQFLKATATVVWQEAIKSQRYSLYCSTLKMARMVKVGAPCRLQNKQVMSPEGLSIFYIQPIRKSHEGPQSEVGQTVSLHGSSSGSRACLDMGGRLNR